MEMIAVFLLLVMQVQAQDMTTEMTFSGDGEGSILTTSYASLIDDNGDIQNISMYDSISSTILTIMGNESNFETILEDESTTSTKFVETTTRDSPTSTSTSDAPTTETTITMEVPTTIETTEQSTTTKMPSTTTLSSTVMETELPTTTSTPEIPTNEGQQCSFVDDDFTCAEDIVCYGEGEMNCEEVEGSPADKISLSSVSEDYSDYESDIETFPPNLVGVKSDKASLPFLFRMGSIDSDNSDLAQKLVPTSTPRKIPSLSFLPVDDETNSFVSPTISHSAPVLEVTAPSILKTVQNVTSQIISTSLNTRRKREESASFHMKKRMRTCTLTGNLVCTPSPTIAMCKGKTLCQVVGGTAETSEKSTSPKGVENWAIAVIAICAIAAALTVSLLVYLIFTSWKKLKVQPQNGVTTLNYVNSSVP